MSTAPADAGDADAASVADTLRDAPFVRVVAAADGDALAASGVLARALEARSTPFQVRIDAVPDPTAVADADAVDDLVVGVGAGATGGDLTLAGGDRPASLVAAAAVRDLGVDPDPILALAGVAAADRPLDAGAAATLFEAAEGRIERRPGLAAPTTDVVDGLAHSTLVHAPFSGDREATQAALASLDLPDDPSATDRRRLASWLSVRATESTPPRAVEAVERVLRPHATPDGRFATIEAFGDVLDAVARERPGTGVAFAIRNAGRPATVEAWRAHARAVHDALAAARTARHDGLLVAHVDETTPGRLVTIARLCRDFRSPEPVVLVVADDGTAAAAASAADGTDLGPAMREAVETVDAPGSSAGDARRASARIEPSGGGGAVDGGERASRLITAFREAL